MDNAKLQSMKDQIANLDRLVKWLISRQNDGTTNAIGIDLSDIYNKISNITNEIETMNKWIQAMQDAGFDSDDLVKYMIYIQEQSELNAIKQKVMLDTQLDTEMLSYTKDEFRMSFPITSNNYTMVMETEPRIFYLMTGFTTYPMKIGVPIPELGITTFVRKVVHKTKVKMRDVTFEAVEFGFLNDSTSIETIVLTVPINDTSVTSISVSWQVIIDMTQDVEMRASRVMVGVVNMVDKDVTYKLVNSGISVEQFLRYVKLVQLAEVDTALMTTDQITVWLSTTMASPEMVVLQNALQSYFQTTISTVNSGLTALGLLQSILPGLTLQVQGSVSEVETGITNQQPSIFIEGSTMIKTANFAKYYQVQLPSVTAGEKATIKVQQKGKIFYPDDQIEQISAPKLSCRGEDGGVYHYVSSPDEGRTNITVNMTLTNNTELTANGYLLYRIKLDKTNETQYFLMGSGMVNAKQHNLKLVNDEDDEEVKVLSFIPPQISPEIPIVQGPSINFDGSSAAISMLMRSKTCRLKGDFDTVVGTLQTRLVLPIERAETINSISGEMSIDVTIDDGSVTNVKLKPTFGDEQINGNVVKALHTDWVDVNDAKIKITIDQPVIVLGNISNWDGYYCGVWTGATYYTIPPDSSQGNAYMVLGPKQNLALAASTTSFAYSTLGEDNSHNWEYDKNPDVSMYYKYTMPCQIPCAVIPPEFFTIDFENGFLVGTSGVQASKMNDGKGVLTFGDARFAGNVIVTSVKYQQNVGTTTGMILGATSGDGIMYTYKEPITYVNGTITPVPSLNNYESQLFSNVGNAAISYAQIKSSDIHNLKYSVGFQYPKIQLKNVVCELNLIMTLLPVGSSNITDSIMVNNILLSMRLMYEKITELDITIATLINVIDDITNSLNELSITVNNMLQQIIDIQNVLNQLIEAHQRSTSFLAELAMILMNVGDLLEFSNPALGLALTLGGLGLDLTAKFTSEDYKGGVIEALLMMLALGVKMGSAFKKWRDSNKTYTDVQTQTGRITDEQWNQMDNFSRPGYTSDAASSAGSLSLSERSYQRFSDTSSLSSQNSIMSTGSYSSSRRRLIDSEDDELSLRSEETMLQISSAGPSKNGNSKLVEVEFSCDFKLPDAHNLNWESRKITHYQIVDAVDGDISIPVMDSRIESKVQRTMAILNVIKAKKQGISLGEVDRAMFRMDQLNLEQRQTIMPDQSDIFSVQCAISEVAIGTNSITTSRKYSFMYLPNIAYYFKDENGDDS